VTVNNKDTRLLCYGIYYGRKKFYSEGCRRERLAKDKHSNLFELLNGDEEKKVL